MIFRMKNTVIRKMLLLLLFIIPICAAAPSYGGTVEIASMTPHYRHPVTGVIEDPGQNEGIGQGMTESVLFPQALVETDDQGRIWITTRNKLAQHISSMKFAVQKRGGSGYTPVPYQVTRTGADFKDTRFQIPSKNSIIRMEFFVEPMGRTVVFYGSMGKLVRGNTDFKVFVNTASAVQSSAPPANMSPGAAAGGAEGGISAAPHIERSSDEYGVSQNVGILSEKSGETGKHIGFDHGLLTRNSPEIKAFLSSAEKKNDSDKEKSRAPYGDITKCMLHILAVIIGISVSALVLCAAALPIAYRMLRNRNNRREEGLYEKEDRLRRAEKIFK